MLEYMPGGWADINRSLSENIIKESKEEAGAEFQKNIGTEESGFFSLDSLPKLSLGRNTKKQIEMCFDAYRENKLE